MSKKIISFLFASSLLLTACGSEENELTVEEVNSEKTEQVEEKEEEKKEEPESIEGSRSNPVPIGKKVTQDFDFYSHHDIESDKKYDANRSIILSNFIRSEEVYDYLMEANQFNEEAPDGMEWAIIDVEYILNEAETEDESHYVSPDFIIIDSSGSEIAQAKVYPTLANGDEFCYVELYAGGTATGKYVFYAPEDDDILIKFDDGNAKPIFFDPNE